MNQSKTSFDSTHLTFYYLSRLIKRLVEIYHIHYREFTSATHMNNKNFRALMDGRDLRLNYYLRFLEYIATYFNTAQAFWTCVKEFIHAALSDMENIMGEKQIRWIE